MRETASHETFPLNKRAEEIGRGVSRNMKVVDLRKPKPKPKGTNNTTRLNDAKRALRRKYKTQLAYLMRKNPTVSEKMMIDLLNKNEIPFQFQVEIIGYIADFYFKGFKSILEVDGLIHREQEEYDMHRDQAFRDAGFRTLRIRVKHLTADPEGVVKEIKAYLANGKVIAKTAAKKRKKARKVTRWQNVPRVSKDNKTVRSVK